LDARYPLLDTPQTWDFIAQYYEIVDGEIQDQILLKRSEANFNSDVQENAYAHQIEVNHVLELPAYSNGVLSVTVHWNLLGRLMKAAYKSGGIKVNVLFEDGTIAEGSIVEDQLRNEVPIYLLSISSRERFEEYLSTGRHSRVVRLELACDYPKLADCISVKFRYND
jgi:hypothetical protein